MSLFLTQDMEKEFGKQFEEFQMITSWADNNNEIHRFGVLFFLTENSEPYTRRYSDD